MWKRSLGILGVALVIVAGLHAIETPLTPLGNLAVRTDENGYLRMTMGTAGMTDGPLTVFGNLRGRTDGNGYLLVSCPSCSGQSDAPIDATYLTQTANATLTNEQAIGGLASGIMRVATTTGVVTSLTTSAGIAANISDETGTGLLVFSADPTLTGLVKFTGTNGLSFTQGSYGPIVINTSDDGNNVLQFTDTIDGVLEFNFAQPPVLVAGDGTGLFTFIGDLTENGQLILAHTFTGTADSAGILSTTTFNNASMTAGELLAIRGVATHPAAKFAGGNVTFDLNGTETYPETIAYASQVNINNTATATTLYGSYIQFTKAAGATVGNVVTQWNSDLSGLAATNAYYYWADSQGVYRIREDTVADTASFPQAVTALYNPRFTKYTAGLANFERVVQQWVGNVATIGTEAGGTGTLRGLNLIGASVKAFHISANGATDAVSNTTSNSCGTTAATIAGAGGAGRITVGATAGTSCTVTFGTAYPTNIPICTAADETTANLMRPTASLTTVIIAGTMVAGDKLVYHCTGF